MLPQVGNPYLASLALGLFYGLTFCTSACLPYVISYIAGIKAGFRKGIIVTSIYNVGRVTAYALIGVLIGLFKMFVSDTFFSVYQKYAFAAFGVTITVIGASILLSKKPSSYACKKTCTNLNVQGEMTRKFDGRAFLMGFTRGLVLCPPLVGFLLYSAAFSGLGDSIILATLFGVGTAFSPLLFLGGATGCLLNKAPLFSRWISKVAAVVLIVLGFNMLLSALVR
ncbi:MAG: sulfite exporter TauE/SafE family protein [Candidatus Bathyarchaeota archaeon]|nr:sulfite exporter TauE/SafE family protein [Candidatus Bathyarchaeota archaeon]